MLALAEVSVPMSRSWLVLPLVLLAGCTAGTPGGGVHIQDIHGLALDPDRPTRLYVATHHGLFVAENDTDWAAVTKEPFDMMGFTLHPLDGNVMYASGHPGRLGDGWAVGVVKSTDAGRTWTTLALKNQVDFHAMAMAAGPSSGEDRVYGHHGGKIHWSTDGGRSWSSKAVPFSVASMAVDPRTGDLLAATDQGLQRIDRALAGPWTPLAAGRAVAVAAANHSQWAYFAATGLGRSLDGGRTWLPMNWTAPADDRAWGIAPGPDPHQAYVGTARGAIQKTTNGGASWAQIR